MEQRVPLGAGRAGVDSHSRNLFAAAQSLGYNAAMRFQFSLRTLFIVVAVAAVACAWLGHEYRVVQERSVMREWIKQHNGLYGVSRTQADLKPSIIRRWLGDETVTFIVLPNTAVNEDVLKAANEFSELEEISVRPN
jgi:hypothetical protein